MTGAIIPDDWDGETFKCFRVNWPQSEQYEAILLGSLSKPAYVDYWDPSTGDEDEAATAIQTAYRSTYPGLWTEECDEPVLVPAFKVKQTSPQALSASAWQVVEWDAFEYEVNDPQFQLAQNVHSLEDSQWFGIWHYDVVFAVTASASLIVRAIDFATNEEISRTYDVDRFISFSWDWLWDDTSVGIGLHAYPSLACDTFSQIYLTQFSGHYVGPTA